MTSRPLCLVVPLLLVSTACASLDTFFEDVGALADPILDEALADESDGAPDLGRALDRSTAEAIDADAARLASLESEMTCTVASFEDFFQREFELFLRWRRREAATSETQRATYRSADRAIGRELRVCGELSERIITGEEPYEQSPDRGERIAALMARYDEGVQEMRRELPAFRRWVRQMMNVR